MELTRRNLLIGATAGVVGGLTVSRGAAAAPNLPLTLTFLGFGTLVVDPSAPKSAVPAATSKTVYVLALTGLTSARHHTRLRIKRKFLKFPPTPGESEAFVEWNLRDYEVTVLGAVETGGVSVANGRFVSCPSTGSTDWDSVEMLGNLARLGGRGHGRVMPALLQDNPPGLVSTRVRLTTGRVKAAGGTGAYENRTWKMKYSDVDHTEVAPGAPAHVLAEHAVHTADVSPWGGIKLEPFPGAAAPAVPLIELVRPPTAATVEVWITNHPGEEAVVAQPVPVMHFSDYYDVLDEKDRPTNRPVPHPVGECNPTTHSGSGSPAGRTGFCPGSLAFTN